MTLEKLEAMTCVCSVGLDMIAIPGDTPAATISGIIADEAAIGMVNNKTTAVRVIPAVGKKAGDRVEFGGLLGSAPVMPVNHWGNEDFIARGGTDSRAAAFPAELTAEATGDIQIGEAWKTHAQQSGVPAPPFFAEAKREGWKNLWSA